MTIRGIPVRENRESSHDPLDGIAEDDPLEEIAVPDLGGEGTEAIPTGYRRTGRRVIEAPEVQIAASRETGNRVLEVPETEISVDPRGERPDRVRTRGEFTEVREVEAPPEDVVRGETTAYEEVAPEPPRRAPQQEGVLPWLRDALETAANVAPPVLAYNLMRSGGREFPNRERLSRALGLLGDGEVRDAIDVALPIAPRPEGMAANEPDHRDRAGMYGLGQSLTLGHLDELSGALPLAGSRTPTQRESIRDRARREIERSARQAPGQYAAGQAAGSAPLALLPGGQTALGRIAVAGGTGLALGAGRGLGESEAEDFAGLARDAGEGALLEGGVSAGLAGAGEVAAPLLARLARQAQRLVPSAVRSRLEATGIWGGPALREADRMRGGREALAADLRRLGIGHGVARNPNAAQHGIARSERSLDDAAEVMDDAGERMRSVLEQMDAASSGRNEALLSGTREQAMRGMVDVSRVADDLDRVAQQYESLPVGGAEVASAIRTRLVEPWRARGQMRFGEAHRQRRLLDDMIRSWSRDPNLATSAGQLQAARRSINEAMDEAAANLDPAIQQQWRQANRDYSVGAFVGERGRGIDRQSIGGGMGTQVAEGLGNAIGTMPGGGVFQALGGGREIAEQQRRWWPGARTRGIEGLIQALRGLHPDEINRALGPGGQRVLQMLTDAERRGPRALAATHFALSRTNPEYRAATERLEEQE